MNKTALIICIFLLAKSSLCMNKWLEYAGQQVCSLSSKFYDLFFSSNNYAQKLRSGEFKSIYEVTQYANKLFVPTRGERDVWYSYRWPKGIDYTDIEKYPLNFASWSNVISLALLVGEENPFQDLINEKSIALAGKTYLKQVANQFKINLNLRNGSTDIEKSAPILAKLLGKIHEDYFLVTEIFEFKFAGSAFNPMIKKTKNQIADFIIFTKGRRCAQNIINYLVYELNNLKIKKSNKINMRVTQSEFAFRRNNKALFENGLLKNSYAKILGLSTEKFNIPKKYQSEFKE